MKVITDINYSLHILSGHSYVYMICSYGVSSRFFLPLWSRSFIFVKERLSKNITFTLNKQFIPVCRITYVCVKKLNNILRMNVAIIRLFLVLVRNIHENIEFYIYFFGTLYKLLIKSGTHLIQIMLMIARVGTQGT